MKNAPKIMMIGATGAGKTFGSLLIAKEIPKVRVIFTEPGMDVFGAEKFPLEIASLRGKSLHTMYMPAANAGIDSLLTAANQVNTMSYQTLKNLPETSRASTNEFVKIIEALKNFKSDETGEEFGRVETWDTDTVLVIDSLTGIAYAAMRCVVGSRVTLDQHHWGMAMGLIENLLIFLTMNCRCWVIITAHPEREVNEVTGRTDIFASVPGKKLAPKIGRFFSEIIEVKRNKSEYFWSNTGENIDVKSRLLPQADKMPPSWDVIVRNAQKMSIGFNPK